MIVGFVCNESKGEYIYMCKSGRAGVVFCEPEIGTDGLSLNLCDRLIGVWAGIKFLDMQGLMGFVF